MNPSNEHSGLISFRIGWFDLPTIQETQESSTKPQFKSINSSAIGFLYSLTLISIHDYWKKIIALIRWIFVSKKMSLLFNRLSRLVIAFLPRGKHLLISWLQSPSAVILEPPPPQIKSVTVSISRRLQVRN